MIIRHEDGSLEGPPLEPLKDAIEELKKLSPEEQQTARKKLYENMTRRPYIPPSSTMSEVEGEKGITPEEAKQRIKEAIEAEREHPPLTAPRPKPKKE